MTRKTHSGVFFRWRDYQWPLLGGLWLGTLYLGYVGFVRHFAALGESRSFWDLLYLALQLFPLQSGAVLGPVPGELQVARWLAPSVAAYTALRALLVMFSEQLQAVRLLFVRNHVVICGLGRMGMLLARGFVDRGDRVVVIERDEGNDYIAPCRDSGAIVLVGSATDRQLLHKAGVPKARYVISVCGDDSTNAEVAVHTRAMCGDAHARATTCFVHIVEPRLYHLLRERELVAESGNSFRLEFLNIFDRGAQLVLEGFPAFPAEGCSAHKRPHVLVVGLGRMGETLVVHIAREWWMHNTDSERMRITIVDREAKRKVDVLGVRYPQLGRACEMIPRQMEIRSAEFEQGGLLCDADGGCDVNAVYVCFDNDPLALTTGLALLHQAHGRKMPVVVRMAHATGLATLLSTVEENSFANLHAFGLLDRTCQPELILGGTHEILARAIHEDYVARQTSLAETRESNPSLVAWEELAEEPKEANRQQADHISAKLKAVGCGVAPLTDWDAERFHLTGDEVEVMAEMEHCLFVEELQRAGWTDAAHPNNKGKKTCAGLVPWDELSEPEKEKDRATVRRVPVFLARAGFQVYRVRDSG